VGDINEYEGKHKIWPSSLKYFDALDNDINANSILTCVQEVYVFLAKNNMNGI
jgi:hypothetical protein